MELQEILNWIINNTDDEVAMDKIAKTAYPHSAKYKNRYTSNEVDVHI